MTNTKNPVSQRIVYRYKVAQNSSNVGRKIQGAGFTLPFKSSAPILSPHCKIAFPNTAVLELLDLLRTSDKNTYQHSLNVAGHVYNFSALLNLNNKDTQDAYYAALLHDVGKLQFLNLVNTSGALTIDEKIVLNEHPIVSYLFLTSCGCSDTVRYCGLFHHYNMSREFGYPHFTNGLVAEIARIATKFNLHIPNERDSRLSKIAKKQWQIINVVTLFDSLDTITNVARHYRKAIPLSEVVRDFNSNEKYNWNTLYDQSMKVIFQTYISMLQEQLSTKRG